ncbi:MAG: carbohydrate porin [Deltaproteobacteria bacterium]|nr:carbohydrate porin [Deltaproteobacteria bacterium]
MVNLTPWAKSLRTQRSDPRTAVAASLVCAGFVLALTPVARAQGQPTAPQQGYQLPGPESTVTANSRAVVPAGAPPPAAVGAPETTVPVAPLSAMDPGVEPPGQLAASTPGTAPGTAATPTEPAAATPELPRAAGLASRPVRWMDGFSFGSYGRVVISTDLRGHSGRPANIVAWGTRIDDQTYAELEVHRDDDFGETRTRVVTTLAVQGPLFHTSGSFEASIAVRNLYIEARDVLTPGLALWVGSRMYRGDDIYLLNWWPLDNLNTVGAGARYDLGQFVTLALQVGTNRLDSNYQIQSIRVTPRDGVGATQALLLDRPRFLSSAKATFWLNGRAATRGLKFVLYGEGHVLPDGVRQSAETGAREYLPSDGGYVLGAQVGAYTGVRDTFINVFARFAQGLAAYGDLSVPHTIASSQTAQRAQDARVAMSANYEHAWFGVLAGGYLRYFRDADAALYGRNDLWEGTLVVRPTVWFGQRAGLSVEASYQGQAFNMLDMETGRARTASQWRFGVMPFVTPAGRGNYTRPHLRAIYAATLRDEGALRLFAPDDPFGRFRVEHYLALSCEWWFNSSYL